jgi:uncharacterized protein
MHNTLPGGLHRDVRNAETTSASMNVTDPVHGSIPLSPLQECLIQTVEVQRLNSIHQLGMTFHVYPSAHSMRFAHALGVSHLAREMGLCLIMDNPDLDLSGAERNMLANLLSAAGLLHDIGHTPWSHTLEPLFLEIKHQNHMEMIENILTGKQGMPIRGAGKIPLILAEYGVDPVQTARLISKTYSDHRFVQQMIFGEVDADTLDYLSRDFYSTGVSFGHIDIRRLLQTMIARPDRLYFKEKGLPAVRDFLNARVEMYSAVYLHKKTRIADLMFLRAARESILRCGEFPGFWHMTDDELLSNMLQNSRSDYVRDICWRIKYRQGLFKRVYNIESGSLSGTDRNLLKAISRLDRDPLKAAVNLEAIMRNRIGIPEGYLLADLVLKAAEISEQRFRELDIVFLDKHNNQYKLEELDRHFAAYINHAQPSRSVLSIYVPEERVSACIDAIPAILNDLNS